MSGIAPKYVLHSWACPSVHCFLSDRGSCQMLCGLLDVPEEQHAFGGCQPITIYARLTYVIINTGFPRKSTLIG